MLEGERGDGEDGVPGSDLGSIGRLVFLVADLDTGGEGVMVKVAGDYSGHVAVLVHGEHLEKKEVGAANDLSWANISGGKGV